MTTPDPAFLIVGRVRKAHGIRGEVVVTLVTDRVERLAPGSVLEADGRTLEVVASKGYPAASLAVLTSPKLR